MKTVIAILLSFVPVALFGQIADTIIVSGVKTDTLIVPDDKIPTKMTKAKVTSIIAGDGINISPPTGVGDVTVSTASSGSGENYGIQTGRATALYGGTTIDFAAAFDATDYQLFIICYKTTNPYEVIPYSSVTKSTTGFTIYPIEDCVVQYTAVKESLSVYSGLRTGEQVVSGTDTITFSQKLDSSAYFLYIAAYTASSPYTLTGFDYSSVTDSSFVVSPMDSATIRYLVVEYDSTLSDLARQGSDSVFVGGTAITFSTAMADANYALLVRCYKTTEPYDAVGFDYGSVTASGFTVYPLEDAICDYAVLAWSGIATGIFTLNTLQTPTQSFAVDSAGNTWAITSSGSTHTFKYPGTRLAYIDIAQTFVPTQKFGNTASYVAVDSTGILLAGNATVWDDLMFPSTQVRQGATAKPDFDTDTLALMFPEDDSTEIAYIIVQMPHKWKEGSTIYPHVHWLQSQDDTADFSIEYKWFNIGDAFPTTWQYYRMNLPVTSYSAGTKIQQLNEGSGGISGSGKTISSIILIRLKRLYGDGYPNDAAMLQFDIHYEMDALGSKSEYEK
jgi:hypothetical protein